MFITGLGIAVPPRSYTQQDCWAALGRTEHPALTPRVRSLLQGILNHDNGIERRALAVESLEEGFRIDPDTLHARFLANAPRLAERAARQALKQAGLEPGAVDGLVISTCTGYLCPGLTSYVAEALALRPDVVAFNLVGHGCGAALPNLRAAEALLAARGCENVVSICVEVCSAAMYLDNDPGVLISACLFGDGAGAAVLSREPPAGRRRVAWRHSVSSTLPQARVALRFEQRGGLLRNVLTRAVPRLAAERVDAVLDTALGDAGLRRADLTGWILHAGGRDVLLALEDRLGLAPLQLRHSRAALRDYGNLSSAFVYFVLEAALAAEAPGGWWWMSSFGAGFTCHGALLEVA